jgi:hypothetical protein
VWETPPLGVNTEGFARNRPLQGEAPIVLPVFNPADWEGKKAPPRLWVVPDDIPNRNVTLLYADGGTGKSYLELQLAVARALGKEWIGLLPAVPSSCPRKTTLTRCGGGSRECCHSSAPAWRTLVTSGLSPRVAAEASRPRRGSSADFNRRNIDNN